MRQITRHFQCSVPGLFRFRRTAGRMLASSNEGEDFNNLRLSTGNVPVQEQLLTDLKRFLIVLSRPGRVFQQQQADAPC